MSEWPRHPIVYEIHTRVWLDELSRREDRPVTLASVPTPELERLAGLGVDGVWLMGVWERSPAARAIAWAHPGLREAYRRALPDFGTGDVLASPYAVRRYEVDPVVGGEEGLARLRHRLAVRGVRLMLDFVPNHLAIDHPWIETDPRRFVHGAPDEIERTPGRFFAADVRGERHVLAHGRDPHFDPWTDTVQLDYRRAETRRAMEAVLRRVAGRCDGVRCDMAMLVTREVFRRTWGGAFEEPAGEFWHSAIERVRSIHLGFLLLAEVYWGLEPELQRQGFDYTYDKTLYDRVLGNDVEAVRSHLRADPDYQRRLARFVENHDEDRAVAVFGRDRSLAVATAVLTLPGLRLLHDGQIEGRRVRIPVQLGRRPREDVDEEVATFYRRLLPALGDPVFREGAWRPLDPREAWPGNSSHRQFVASCWTLGEESRLAVVNLGSDTAQCRLPFDESPFVRAWTLRDLLGGSEYDRDGNEIRDTGLFVELPGYGRHLFQARPG